ncbi:hypothetical protein AMTR_s00023p00133110 [Amborella trichopoda]|uniref:Uncharacterized protein n=1 Tax=Amborella trichopoda TaxID=13333 RepID=W1NJG5_AMBTC|nr:hypothetical protein AMTR_s00023p00133110 [Amborella trichopoda]
MLLVLLLLGDNARLAARGLLDTPAPPALTTTPSVNMATRHRPNKHSSGRSTAISRWSVH